MDSFHTDGAWHLEVEPLCGFRYGMLGEYVYYDANTKDKLSELQWDVKPLFYVGGKISGGWKGLCLSATVKGMIPSQCGELRDSDWLQDAGYKTGNRSIKTNYSVSENHLDSGISFSMDLKAKFYPSSWFAISPVIGFSMDYFKFSGKNGTAYYGKPLSGSNYSYYSSDDVNNRVVSKLYGDVIKYERFDFYAWMGFETDFILTKRCNISFEAAISPYTSLQGLDSHLMRSLYFLDTSEANFSAFNCSLAVSIRANKTLSFALNVLALYTKELKTTTSYISENSTSGPYIKTAPYDGASSKYFDTTFFTKISF